MIVVNTKGFFIQSHPYKKNRDPSPISRYLILPYQENYREIKRKEDDPTTMKLNIDIMEINNKVIVIGNGKVKYTDLPEHGETTIVTHQGKVKRVKWDEGEEF